MTKKQNWSKDGKLLGHIGKETDGQKHYNQIISYAIKNEKNELSDGNTIIKCKTWLNRYKKKLDEEIQKAGLVDVFKNMGENWVMNHAKALESIEPILVEWSLQWKIHISSKQNKSFLEQLGNANGITTKELFSGKYGNNVTEIMTSMMEKIK